MSLMPDLRHFIVFIVGIVASTFCVSTALAAGPAGVTQVRFARLADSCDGAAPVTFGQPFRDGDVASGQTLALYDGDQRLPTQVDVRRRNPDGSLRHAVITADLPCDTRPSTQFAVAPVAPAPEPQAGTTLNDLAASRFDAVLDIVRSGGGHVTASARDLMRQIAQAGGCEASSVYCRRWLQGPLANEWIIGAPPRNDDGHPDPHLMVFFAVRAYGLAGKAPRSVRVDTVVENTWAYAVRPSNITYDATIKVPGRTAFEAKELPHYTHARWHHRSWWGQADGPAWFAALNGYYLQATPAIPSYQNVSLDQDMLGKVTQACRPMASCDVMPRMEATGAQGQIGPLPRWSSAYIVAPNDYRTYRWMLANSDALGSYGIHYRQKSDMAPLSVKAHPCATLVQAAAFPDCAVPPHADDRFPACAGECTSPLQAEPAHHGAPAYVAYVVTGDWYYAQELALWADYLIFTQNPKYRGYRAGLVHEQQARSQAWDLRTLGDAAYILPGRMPITDYLNTVVANNIQWYNAHYGPESDGAALGVLTNGLAVTYPSSGASAHTGIATWQMSFFTWATGNLVDLEFDGARQMLDHFSRFQIGALTDPGFCREMASAYTLKVRDRHDEPFYSDFATVYRKSFPKLSRVGCDPKALNDGLRAQPNRGGFDYPPGTMVGYPKSDTGFVANYQIGLAAAVTSTKSGRDIWRWFMRRPVRPDYRQQPQFAIVPSMRVDPSPNQ